MKLTSGQRDRFSRLAEALDVPRSYYEKAADRHRSLGEWFCRPGSTIARLDPRVHPQGSFRLGTVIRPLLADEEYDLDTVCELLGLTKLALTQQDLKRLVGLEVHGYAAARQIKDPVVERKRCWRLDYADEVKFHVDILPCLPEDASVIQALVGLGVDASLAKLAIALTCKEHELYRVVCTDWPKGNPAGYALWFEGRMGVQGEARRKQLLLEGRYASVQAIPAWELKTPLQRAIQILKRHRDVMFQEDADGKPISIVITTLAALAYEGEASAEDALRRILSQMPRLVRPSSPRVPNPVNPAEDFADKWRNDPRLEQNFWDWHEQASRDVEALAATRDSSELRRRLRKQFNVDLSDDDARATDGIAAGAVVPVAWPSIQISGGPSPWSNRR
jgi:hypothetical protein